MPGPTPEEIARARAWFTSREPAPRRNMFSRLSEPLTDLPSRISRRISGSEGSNPFSIFKMREKSESPWAASVLGFLEGATEGLGDTLTEMTSPLDLAATATGLGVLKAPKRFRQAARGLDIAANLGVGSRGAYNVGDALVPDDDVEGIDWAKLGSGALESATSLAGMRSMPNRRVRVINKPPETPAIQGSLRTEKPKVKVQDNKIIAINNQPISPQNTRPYEKVSDSILNGLAQAKNADAIAELNFRKVSPPNISGESGSVASDIFSTLGKGTKDFFNLNLINQDLPRIQKVKDDYVKWVNERAARKGKSFLVKEQFKDLEDLGMEGVFAYNAGERGGRLADVEDFFNNYHTDLDARRKALGVRKDLGFKENYLPQIWENSAEEVANVFGKKRLTLQPRIAMKSIIDTYQEGIDKGLTPKYKSIPDLMTFYTEIAEKSIADRTFFNALKDKELIKPGSSRKVGADWKPLPRDIFPTIKTKKGGRIDYYAPPEIHEVVSNYLGERNPTTQRILNGIQITKDIALASGLPGTAFNAHGFNMLRRSTAVNGLSGFVNGLKFMMKSGSDENMISRGLNKILPWESANNAILRNKDIIPEVMEMGGRLGVEGHEFNNKLATTLLGKGIDKVTGWHQSLFETHLFDKMIPALKLDYYKSSVSDLVQKGMPEIEAKRNAAKAMNLAFAGVNYDELATNKNMLDLARMFLLAPDWYASNIGLVKNAGQSIMNSNHPGAALYKKAAAGMLATYTASNVLNYINTEMNEGKGRFMWQNESGRTFDIDTGGYTINDKGQKKKIYISPFGTAFDAAKIPLELITNAFKGDINKLPDTLRNRTSLPAHSAINFLSKTNDFGERMFGEDLYGRDIPLSKELQNLTFDVALKPVTPAYMQGVRGLFSGRMSPFEAASQSIEAPLLFKRQDTSNRRRRRSR